MVVGTDQNKANNNDYDIILNEISREEKENTLKKTH